MGVLWVAEIGSMHKGDKSLAFELIRQAKEAGASIAKFQFGWTREAQEQQGLNYLPVRYVDDWAEDLAKWCAYFDIELMASIWSKPGLAAAQRVRIKRYKIASQKAHDLALCDLIYADGKPTFVSMDWDSPDWGFHRAHRNGSAIFCKSKYPVYPEDWSQGQYWQSMPSLFKTQWFGYSDHAHGIEACLLAVAHGAQYIEKHFCLNKADLTVRDTPFSATPAEFAEMVRIGNGIQRLFDVSL